MKTYDVFISHASEDKASVAQPLAERLTRAGLRVWLDAFELRIGDSLREKIDQGLSQSKFGIVILSQNFFQKAWPRREVNALFAIEDDGDKVILPVWHQVDKPDVKAFSPMLADRFAANTSLGLDAVARAIADVVQKEGVTATLERLIQTGPPVEGISEFLAMRPKILADAIGQYGLFRESPQIIQHPEVPPFHLISCALHGTDGSYDCRCISFLAATPSGADDCDLVSTLGHCSKSIQNANSTRNELAGILLPRNGERDNVGPLIFRGAVFYGRRELISAAARSTIRLYGQSGVLLVHSYDRLLEASATSA
jgi:hypothetical protein